MADVKPDTRTDAASELGLLRRALVEIEARLEAVEEWRALRQLDERERSGSPLEGIDGVLFRGRLVQKLAESSRDWRAYVRIEEAIGQLQGPVRLEAGILEDSARFEVAKPAAALVKAAPKPAPAIDLPQKTAAIVESPAASANAPDDAPEQQRVRVKVRAGSSAVSPENPVVRPGPAAVDIVIARPAPPVRPEELPAVASLSPRPLPEAAAPIAPELTTPADQRSPRSVLQRIRLVSKVRPPEANSRSSDGDDGLLGTPSAPLIEPVVAPQPQATPKAAMHVNAADGSHGTLQPVADWTAEGVDKTASVVPAVTTAWQAGAPGDATNRASDHAVDVSKQRRLDDLEAELEILIDKSASWPHPLDAHRDRDDRDGRSDRRLPTTLEPDAPVELDVDEAEVTIIRHSEPLVAESPASVVALELESRIRLPQASMPAMDDVDGDDYAGYHLALEEASVEIVVSGEPEATDGKPAADNDRGAPDNNRPTFRRRVLTGE